VEGPLREAAAVLAHPRRRAATRPARVRAWVLALALGQRQVLALASVPALVWAPAPALPGKPPWELARASELARTWLPKPKSS
jgi:hypothetical protein